MEKDLRILILEDQISDAALIERELRKGGITFTLKRVDTEADFVREIDAFLPDIILADYKLPSFNGLASLAITRQKYKDLPFIMVTGTIGDELAVETFKMGANDYVLKDRLARLVPSVKKALHEREERSKLKQSEEALRASEAKYRQLYENMMDAFGAADTTGRIIESNTALRNLLGYTEEELHRLTYMDITPERWHDLTARNLELVLSRGYSDLYEKEYLRKDGTPVPIEIRTVLLKDNAGHPSSYWAIIRDIRDRKKAEISLQVREEKYRKLSNEFQTLLDNIPDSIIHLTPELRIIWANKAMAILTGSAEQEMLNARCCHESLWGLKTQCPECPVLRCFDSRHLEIGTLTTSNNKILELRAVPILDESGNVNSVIEVIRDVTEHRSLEDQMRQAQKMEAIGQLAGGISHDFNNVLSAIIGYGHLTLMKMQKDDPLRMNIESMVEGADRAVNLIKDLLLFSRKQKSECKPVDLNDIIRTVEKFLFRIIGEDIDCKTVLNEDSIMVLADRNQLGQVLMNFGTNARDAMPHGGVFTITTGLVDLDRDFISVDGVKITGTFALITVSDTGIGMTEETRQRIFEPFYTTKDPGKGTGLGMAVVYGIISQHNGYIGVDSELGKGTTIKLYLPFIKGTVKEIVEERLPAVLAYGTETILLAEDDRNLRKLNRVILTQFGYTVIEAVDGEDAVKKFVDNKDKIHLLLFDILMPGMNGLEAYNEILKIRPDIKVIFESGYSRELIDQKVTLENTEILIIKPTSPHALLETVRRVLDQAK